MSSVECPQCRKLFTLDEFLNNCSLYNFDLDVVVFLCPECGAKVDARVEDRKVTLGYLYGAGNVHFSGMVEYKFPDLRRVFGDASGLKLQDRGKDKLIPS